MHGLVKELLGIYGPGYAQVGSSGRPANSVSLGDDAAILGDSASVRLRDDCGRLAFSTDTFVVTPHFFPGGDIGRLAVCGTVNDVATSGATPKWLSVGLVLEEGFLLDDLRRVCASIAQAAREAGVEIVTGDTKVVDKGHGDGIFINTSGIGVFDGRTALTAPLSGANCQPGDKILVSGTIGDHGVAIVSTREGLAFSTTIMSDAAPLNHLVSAVLAAAPNTRCFRDPTRGGLASALNELAAQSNVRLMIDEDAVPVAMEVRGACEMLGFDVFQVANEGKMVAVVAPQEVEAALAAMRASKYGENAAIIGEVMALEPAEGQLAHNSGGHGSWARLDAQGPEPGAAAGRRGMSQRPRVLLRTAYGATRIMDVLAGEQLPRIC